MREDNASPPRPRRQDRRGWAWAPLVLFGVLACAKVSVDGANGEGGAQAVPGTGGAAGLDGGLGDAPHDVIFTADVPGACQSELRAVVRDFRSSDQDGQPRHPDFENIVAMDKGIVAPMLGADMKPVYAGGTTGTTTGQANFDQWYRDVPGVNQRFEIALPLTADPARPGVFVYDNDAFYPIDGLGWGNQYLTHNQDFTTELHFNFPYRGGEIFTFRGDDDVFLFMNGILAVDLGGVHSAESGTIDLDASAAALGLEKGQTYQMDIFQADRHCCESTFHIETTLACVDSFVIP